MLDVVLSEMGRQRQRVRNHGKPQLERAPRSIADRRLRANSFDPFSASSH
jgi:hypothetical protein